MAWSPVSGLPPQNSTSGNQAADYWIKFYASGTTSPTAMATDSTGGTTLAKAQTDGQGYFQNGSSDPFIPHINKKYRAVLYANDADADANAFASAVYDIDALFPVVTTSETTITTITKATIAAATADDDLVVGSYVRVVEFSAGYPINSLYEIIAGNTTEDGSKWNSDTVGLFYLQLVPEPVISGYVFGILPNGSDMRTPFQRAFTYINGLGGGKLLNPHGSGTYNVDCTNAALTIYSNTEWDLGGNTIHRTDAVNRRMIGNKNYGLALNDTKMTVRNGKITGIGENTVTTDQGAGLAFFDASFVTIEQIETEGTTGDGILYKRVNNMTLRDINIGAFGRNGISPVSGLDAVWDNVNINGVPFTNANPGLDIDGENDSTAERSTMKWNAVTAKNVTLVDLHAPLNDTFAHELEAVNCEIGPGFNAFKVLASNSCNALNIQVGATNKITSNNTGPAVLIQNVDGVDLSAVQLDLSGTPSGSPVAISIGGVVNELRAISPRVSSQFSFALQAFSTARVNDSIFSGLNGNVYLGGSDNVFLNSDIPALTINGADSLDNIIKSDCVVSTIANVNSGDILKQHFGGVKGIQSKTYFSKSVKVPNGVTYDLTVPLPDATGSTNGRAATIVANYSHRGDASNWAQLMTTIAWGDLAKAERTVISTSNGGSGAIVILSVAIDSCVVRLNYAYEGVFSVTVLG